MVHARRIAIADEYERTRTRLKHEGKILPTHDRHGVCLDVGGTSDLHGDIRSERCLSRMVMRHWVSASIAEFDSRAMQPRDRRGNLANASLEEVANLWGERPCRALQFSVF